MDYGLFRKFEKIDRAAAYPRTSQENGFFLVELRFVADGETRSVPATFEVERSAFGEILRVHIEAMSKGLDAFALAALEKQLEHAAPVIELDQDLAMDRLTLHFVEGAAQSKRRCSGALIFDGQGKPASIMIRLRN